MLSSAERCDIAARSSGLYDRVARLQTSSSNRPSPDVALERERDARLLLAAWTHAYAPGDRHALERRLSWDGLTPQLVAAATTLTPDADAPPWTAWLVTFGETARGVASILRCGPLREIESCRESEPPFVELWIAILHAARAALAARVTLAAANCFARAASANLECQLLRELATYGELAVNELFSAHLAMQGVARETCTPDESSRYREFILSTLDDALDSVWRAYPVLARQIVIVVEAWIDSTTELMTRFAIDRSRIAATLNDGVDTGVVTRIDPAMSDPHEGRRRVAILEFDGGRRIVYKPRSVRTERAFAQLIAWTAERGLEPRLPASRLVEGDDYGWIEYAEHQPLQSDAEVSRYYRQAGVLILLTHVLGSRDLHMENLVATREGPVLIDLELLMQPASQPMVESDVERSCLQTGLLSLVEFGANDLVFDVGGLRGSGIVPLAISRRAWRHHRSDAVTFVDESTVSAPVKNAVVVDGRVRPPDAFAADILEGFSRAYRFILDYQDDALAPDGPFDGFRGAIVRVLARPTNQYALLNVVRNAPRYQGDGLVRSIVVDILFRPLAGAGARPREWPLIVEERRAIEALDVPRLLVPAESRTVQSSGRSILDDYYAQSPLACVFERIRGLSEADGLAQRSTLARGLRESTASRLHTEPCAAARDFVGHAEWIGRELLDRASTCVDPLVWTDHPLDRAHSHDLYGGTLGPALFLAALAAVTGEARWDRAARSALAPAVSWALSIDPSNEVSLDIGGCSGLGSIVYGLTCAGALLGETRAIDSASRVAALIDAERICADRVFDVVGGSAGAILGVLALYAQTSADPLLKIARACGDHLLAHHLEVPGGWAWPSTSRRRLVGFAHGAAGIATALNRLAGTTGCTRYRDAAARALGFVGRLFSPVDANWPAAAPEPSDIGTTMIRMSAWCHGAPGIALATASCLDISCETTMLTDVRRAVAALPRWSMNQADHLCCGHFGRVDVLLTGGRVLDVPDAADMAWQLAERVVERARARRHFRLSTPGVEYRVFDAGLFRGLSGIGYELLRLAVPERLPSVLCFEPIGHSS